MKYAVIKTGGKQYRVSEGDTITVESLTALPNEKVQFNNVLLCVAENGEAIVGTPTVQHSTVFGRVVDHVRGEKIRVAVFHAKVRHRTVRGHRQRLTTVRIEKIATTASNAAGAGDTVQNIKNTKKRQRRTVVTKIAVEKK